MVTNPYVTPYVHAGESDLHADLIIESIQMYGQDVYYLPRTKVNFDDATWNQDDMSEFNEAYVIEMYIKSVDSFEGEGSFLSKFGLEIRDRVSLSVARRRFTEVVTTVESTIVRPREGDLIYFAMTKKLFEVIYCDNRALFYPLGSLPLFDLSCEVFEFNGEKFNTGITAIDEIAESLSVDQYQFADRDGNGDVVIDADGNIVTIPAFDIEEQDVEFDNFKIEEEAEDIVDFSDFDPFSRGS